MRRYGRLMALAIAGMLVVVVRLGMVQDTCPPTPDCPCHHPVQTP
jgi:hypothetical protein